MLQRLKTTELTDQDLVWMMKALAGHYGGYAPYDIVSEIYQGLPHEIYRITTPAEGVIITTELTHPAGKELLVWWLAGKNVMVNLDQIFSELKDIAQDRDCRWISGAAQSMALGRYCQKKLGCVSQDKLYTIEVNHGRKNNTQTTRV